MKAALMLLALMATPDVTGLVSEARHIENASIQRQEKANQLVGLYRRTIAPLDSKLRSLSDHEVRSLFDLTHVIASYSYITSEGRGGQPITSLRRQFEELSRRNQALQSDVVILHRLHTRRRDFAWAEALRMRHPVQTLSATPRTVAMQAFDVEKPALLRVSVIDGVYELENVEPGHGKQIVAVGMCHIAEDAAKAIAASESLMRAFRAGQAFWVSGSLDSLEKLDVWNARFVDQPMSIAYENRTWLPLELTASPIFYLLDHGRVIASLVGWPRDGDGIATLESWLDAPKIRPD